MRRRNRNGHKGNEESNRHDNSRLSPLVLNNPVNQSAYWSHESYHLQDLVTLFPLPRVVRCASKLLPGGQMDLPFNIYMPMLLCSGRSVNKILAKHVSRDPRTHHLKETDDSIVIPSDYDGHFLRLQARTTKDKSAVRTLQYIASHPIPAFISLTPIKSLTVSDNLKGSLNNLSGSSSEISKGSKSSSKHGIHLSPKTNHLHPAGSVFVVSGTTKGQVKVRGKTKEITLLRCTTEEGQEVFLPTDQAGEFLEVEIPGNGSTKLSVLPHDLITANQYPRLVRYVYGDHPPRLTPCSKMFTLIDTFEEDSVIGCLLYPNHALIIEVPMTSSLNFQVAMNHEEVMSMPLPLHAMDVVQRRQEVFIRDLKLKCKFIHQVNSGFGQPVGLAAGGVFDDMQSATMRARQFADEAFFYL